MRSIDLFFKILDEAENGIDYEYHPQDGVGFSAKPPGITSMPNVKSVVQIFQKDAEGTNIHRALFEFNPQGQLESVTIQ